MGCLMEVYLLFYTVLYFADTAFLLGGADV